MKMAYMIMLLFFLTSILTFTVNVQSIETERDNASACGLSHNNNSMKARALSEAPQSSLKSPRSDSLILYYYGDVESAYAALKAGQIDAVGCAITADLFVDASTDPNIVLGAVADSGFYEVDLNNNYTIVDYPGVPSPMWYQGFRQAVAFLLDKDWVIDEICGGFAERIDQMIAASYKGWTNTSMWYPNYPYEYDPTLSAAALDGAGFVQGSTANLYYDNSFPGSAEYIRTYPIGHPSAGSDLDPLVVCVRSDDIRLLEAGRLLYANMQKHGIPINPIEGSASTLYDRVMGDFNYHLYTGGWSVGRFPALNLYGLYHSSSYFSYGSNYVTGVNSTGSANYRLDALLEAARFPDTFDEAVSATKLAAGYMTDLCVNIPMFSAKSYWAWSKELLGVVNAEGFGPENGYTFMNAYKIDGSAIRYGLASAPLALNIVHSQWDRDYQNLDSMNLYGGVDVPPYDLSVDQPGFVTERLVGMWYDGDTNKSEITYTYRSDIYFVEPVTGNQLENVNASHVYASIWYDYQIGDGWFWSDVQDVHHLNLVDPNTIEIYFDSYSYWNAYAAQPPIKSFNLLQKGTLSVVRTETIIGFTGPGFLGLSHKPFWVTSITGLGGLTQGTDWEIVRNGPSGYADVYIYKAGTGDIEITYYSVEDATGYTLGNLPWEDAFEGAGAWYATAFTPGVGGNLTLKKPFFYVGTPLLGEIDWVKKPSGCYKIDIFDVVIAASAYGSQGTGVPSPNWFAGADVALPGGKINIFDIVTITSKYCQECAPMIFYWSGSAYSFAW